MFGRICPSATNLGEMVDKHDMVGYWRFRDENRVLFLDSGLKAFGGSLGRAEKLEESDHRLVAVFVCRIVFEEVLPVVC